MNLYKYFVEYNDDILIIDNAVDPVIEHWNTFKIIQKNYYETITELKKKNNTNNSVVSADPPSSAQSVPKFELPEISLPKFNGTRKDKYGKISYVT